MNVTDPQPAAACPAGSRGGAIPIEEGRGPGSGPIPLRVRCRASYGGTGRRQDGGQKKVHGPPPALAPRRYATALTLQFNHFGKLKKFVSVHKFPNEAPAGSGRQSKKGSPGVLPREPFDFQTKRRVMWRVPECGPTEADEGAGT